VHIHTDLDVKPSPRVKHWENAMFWIRSRSDPKLCVNFMYFYCTVEREQTLPWKISCIVLKKHFKSLCSFLFIMEIWHFF
jgi:hypothetical protein